jgi:hypothetical protein
MQVEFSKVTARGWEKQRIADGSLRLLRYAEARGGGDLLAMEPGYRKNEYTLRVSVPGQRDLDKVVLVVKSSANCFRVAYSDAKRTEVSTCGTYCDLNLWIMRLDQIPIGTPQTLTG